VLSIGKLRKGDPGEYVLRAVARGAEDYYSGLGESPGEWIGGGCDALSLSGEVDPEAFRRVLRGCDPATGEQLVRRTVPGFDLTFSPPKSVSVLWGLAPAEIARQVAEAHHEAVAAALGYMEAAASGVARRVDGTLEIRPSSGFVASRWDHRTSRAGDPQLHSHVVVANLARGEDGRWSSLGRHPDLYTHALAGGYLYQAHLRAALTARLGVAWSEVERGSAEIVGVDPAVVAQFSKRRDEVLAAAREQGDLSASGKQVATLATRRPKVHGRPATEWSPNAGDYGVAPAPTPSLRERWQAETSTSLDLTEIVGRGEAEAVDDDALVAELVGASGLTELASTFSRRDVVRAVAERTNLPATQVLALVDRVLAHPEVVDLGARRGVRRYTTQALLSAEWAVVRDAQARAHAGVGVVDPEAVEVILTSRKLTPDQEQMVRQLTSGGAGVDVVVGLAGTGKTFALDACRQAWEADGIPVRACALSARATGEVRRGARIDRAETIARTLIELHRDGLPAGCVVVVDEAGMADSRSLAGLSRAVSAAGGKLVLVGDHRQLAAVEAGGLFALLAERLPHTVTLSSVRRQADEADRAALADVRHGDLAAGVAALVGRSGRLVVAENETDQTAAMVADWLRARQDGHEPLVLAGSRARAEALSRAIRSERIRRGELGDDELTVGITPEPTRRRRRTWLPPERSYRAGDAVLFTRNLTEKWRHLRDQMPGVHNGATGRVVAVDPERRTISVVLDGPPDAPPGDPITVDSDYLAAGHVAYAAARTVHAAQGATADAVLVDGQTLRGREQTYVAFSRHRQDVRTYLVASPPAEEPPEAHVEQPKVESSPLDRFLRRVSTRQAQEAAVAQTTRERVAEAERERELATLGVAELARRIAAVERAAPPQVESAAAREVRRLEASLAAAPESSRRVIELQLARARDAATRSAARQAAEPRADLAELRVLRRAEARAVRLDVEVLAAAGGGPLGPRPERGSARRRWEAAAAEYARAHAAEHARSHAAALSA